MHKFRSNGILIKLRIVSFFILLFPVLLLGIAVLIGYGFWHQDHDILVKGLYLMAGTALYGMIVGLISLGLRCPLCRAQLFRTSGCSINHKAERIFGSVRLHVAMGVLFKGYFRCPFCGEPCDATNPRRP